jgi:hypothetical protein
VPGAGLEHPPRLLGAEHPLLAEDVAEARQARLGRRRHDLLAHQVDVPAAIGAVLGRHLVGGEQGRHQVDRVAAPAAAIARELLELAVRSTARSRSSPRRSWCRGRASGRGDGGRSRTARPRRRRGWRRPSTGCRRRPRRSPGRWPRPAAGRTRPRAPAQGRCVWGSTNPGTRVPPAPSSRSASGSSPNRRPALLGEPTKTIRPSRQRTSASRSRSTRDWSGPRGRRAEGGRDLGETGDEQVGHGGWSVAQGAGDGAGRGVAAPVVVRSGAVVASGWVVACGRAGGCREIGPAGREWRTRSDKGWGRGGCLSSGNRSALGGRWGAGAALRGDGASSPVVAQRHGERRRRASRPTSTRRSGPRPRSNQGGCAP